MLPNTANHRRTTNGHLIHPPAHLAGHRILQYCCIAHPGSSPVAVARHRPLRHLLAQPRTPSPCRLQSSVPLCLCDSTPFLAIAPPLTIDVGHRCEGEIKPETSAPAPGYSSRGRRPNANAIHDRRQCPPVQFADPVRPTTCAANACTATSLYCRQHVTQPTCLCRWTTKHSVAHGATHAVENDKD